MTYIPYPRRLYLHGEVLPNDPHATNSVVVNGEEEEVAARARGYRKAYEIGSNGGSPSESEPALSSAPDEPAHGSLPRDQGGAAPASATPSVDELRAQLEAAGVKVDGRWKEARLLEELGKVRQ
jgi:hypothetical protein